MITNNNTVAVRSHMRLYGDLSFDNNRGSFPENPTTNQIVLVDGILYIYSRINDVRTWYPLTHKKTTFIHVQGIAASEWTIQHNENTTDYGFFAYDENGNLQFANTQVIDENSCKLLFSAPIKGKAIMFFDYEITAKNMSTNSLNTSNIEGMFTKVGNDILFQGNLIPSEVDTWSIGSADNPIKEMFVSANTIHLGDSVLSGTNITINDDVGSTMLSQQPTFSASKIIARPYTYNPGNGNITVRPSIEFQDENGISNPISFNSATGEFSLDRAGNHGEGSLIAKSIKANNPNGVALDLNGELVSVSNINTSKDLRVDGNVNLGYDHNSTVTVRGVLDLDTAVTFTENATLGDGNDDITVNCGTANLFKVISQHFSVDESGNLNVSGDLSVQGTLNASTQNVSSVTESTIADNYFIATGGGTNDSGLKVDRGVETEAVLHFNEVNDLWECGIGTNTQSIVTTNDTRLLTDEENTDLTDSGDTTLHFHAADRDRSNHTGSQKASTISDFTVAVNNAMAGALSNKVSIESGKGLSSNDFTNADKTKLDSIDPNSGGSVSWADITGKPNIAYEVKIAADDLTQNQVDNLRVGKLANGDNPVPSLVRPDVVYVTDETVTTYSFEYEPTFLMVFLNRQLLRPSEYTATTGMDITFNVPLTHDDEIEITTATK